MIGRSNIGAFLVITEFTPLNRGLRVFTVDFIMDDGQSVDIISDERCKSKNRCYAAKTCYLLSMSIQP